MKKGYITDIQRFSLNDGPGIRTTVFFKGCNMKCTWCHNPETITSKREIHFYPNKCIGCGECFSACPNSAHYIKDATHLVDRTKCVGCGKCAGVCYAEALTMSGKMLDTEQVMREIVQDKPYYDESSGGVTLSGGEVLCQKDFALEIINECKQNGIKTALETNLNFKFEDIEQTLGAADFIMCDLKIFNSEEHKKHTGVSNDKIIKNIKALDGLNIPFIVRTPLIPGVTDDIENISEIASYIKDFSNLVRYELLNFNPLGAPKYKSLDMENIFEKARPLTEESLSEISASLDKIEISYKIV